MDAQQNEIYSAVLITSFILGFIIIFFVLSVVWQQKRNLALQRQSLLTEINTLEKERTRIAADLHDELGPTLSFIKFHVDNVEVTNEEDRELLKKASIQLDEAVERIRTISRNLMPTTLIRKGLLTALEELAEGINRNTALRIELLISITGEIDAEKSITLYRVFQEIIQNTLKYAQATQFVLQLKETNGFLHIVCEDNGIGFDYEKTVSEQKGLGLRNLRSRIEFIGGSFAVHSVKGKGTQYVFDVPFKSK